MKEYRKKLYVSRAIQGRLLVQLSLQWLLYNLFLWHILFLIVTLPESGVPMPLSQRYVEFSRQHGVLLLCMLVTAPIILWDMVKLSHRMAGPLVRFEKVLEQMCHGEKVPKVTLRKKDMLGEFAAAFNEFIEVWNRELDAREEDDAIARQRDADLPCESGDKAMRI